MQARARLSHCGSARADHRHCEGHMRRRNPEPLIELWIAPLARNDGGEAASYCRLSATKRSSPSALETKSSTDFLPSFLSWSTRFLISAPEVTASCATST